MDFSKLPDTAFLRIFDHLPWEHCIRIGRVSQAFRRISLMVTSRTKCLDLTDGRFWNLTPDQLRVLLDLCSQSLERIKFPDTDYGAECASILASYECPRLMDLDLSWAPLENDIFCKLIRNNHHLESVIWRSDSFVRSFTDPEVDIKHVEYPNVVTENLKNLTLSCCNDATLRSLTDRCPNLERLDLVTRNNTMDVFDQFIASIPQVQQIKLHLIENQIAFEDLLNFWNCPLTSLEIAYTNGTVFANDEVLLKVSTRLPRLKNLNLWLTEATNEGIWSLGDLHELERLDLTLPGDDFDDGIRGLAHCGRLQDLVLYLNLLSSFTLISLLRGCPQLRSLVARAVHDVENGEEAALVLKGLAGMPKRDVTIGFHGLDDEEETYTKSIWETEPVKQVIRELKDMEGFEIKFKWIERQCITEDQLMEWEMEEDVGMENVENDEDI